jgi:hypothetical protein
MKLNMHDIEALFKRSKLNKDENNYKNPKKYIKYLWATHQEIFCMKLGL